LGATTPSNVPVAKSSVDVDWDDEDEATHIFDKGDDLLAGRAQSAPLPAAGAPPPSMSMKSTLLGLTPPPGLLQSTSPGTLPPPAPRLSPTPPAGLPPPSLGTLPPPPSTLQGLGSAARSIPPPPGSPSISSPPMMGSGPAAATVPPARPGGSGRPALGASMPPRSMEATALLRPAQGSAMLWIILGVVAAVMLGLFFLFMPPRTGRIAINVNDAKGAAVGRVEIFVDGRKQCDTAPCIVEGQTPGAHEVKILADGFELPGAQAVSVESRKDSMVAFTLTTASKGTGVRVGGTQPGVKLYVDDKEIGPLPQDYREMSPGDHVVKIVGSERYQPIERRVSLEKDKIEDLGTVTLRVLKGKATVSLSTPGARVFLISGTDRRELPMLPISVDIDTSKNWALQASRVGYLDYNQPISFDDGQAEKTYVVALDPKTGSAVGNAWAPAVPQALSQPAYVAPAPRPAPAPAPAPQPAVASGGGGGGGGGGGEAFLNINSLPPSTCFLDGKPLGATPKVHVSVTPGTHQVKFVNSEQGLTKTITVSVKSGEVGAAITKLGY
jgi:serine/threonine-protein kinase